MFDDKKWHQVLRESILEEDESLRYASKDYRAIDPHNPPSIQEILTNWVQKNIALYDEHIHAYYPVKQLIPWREYTWSRQNARMSPEEYDDLKSDIAERGIQSPLMIVLGRNGKAKIGEGNHRLAILIELGYTGLVPVRFLFHQNVEKNSQNLYESKLAESQKSFKLLEAADIGGKTVKMIMRTIMHAGGKPYIIGGSVRDEMIGKETRSKDIDFVVCGLPLESIANALRSLGKVNMVGKSFGVVKATIEGDEYDFAIPRAKETRVGSGHGDFEIVLDPNAPIEEDLSRRDFTINALAKDPSGKIIDIFGGIQDLKNGIIRAVGIPKERFAEDPLRMLRAIQFATRFNFDIEPKTAQAIRENRAELRRISSERIFEEFTKAWTKGFADSRKLILLLNKLAVGTTLFGVDFEPIEWQNKEPDYSIKTAFVSCFVRGGDETILRAPTDLLALLYLARIVSKTEAENLYKIKNIRRTRLEDVAKVFRNIMDIRFRNLAEKLEKILELPIEPKELDVTGEQLMQLGLSGAQIGAAQYKVLEAVHQGQIQNNHQEILNFISPLN